MRVFHPGPGPHKIQTCYFGPKHALLISHQYIFFLKHLLLSDEKKAWARVVGPYGTLFDILEQAVEHCCPEQVQYQTELIFLLKCMPLRYIFLMHVDFISLPTVISEPKTFMLSFPLENMANISNCQSIYCISCPQFSPCVGLNIVKTSVRDFTGREQASLYSGYYTEWTTS